MDALPENVHLWTITVNVVCVVNFQVRRIRKEDLSAQAFTVKVIKSYMLMNRKYYTRLDII